METLLLLQQGDSMGWTTVRVLGDTCWAHSRTLALVASRVGTPQLEHPCPAPVAAGLPHAYGGVESNDSRNNESYYLPLHGYHGISLEDGKQPEQCPGTLLGQGHQCRADWYPVALWASLTGT